MGQKLIEEAEPGWIGQLGAHMTWDREPKGLWEREQYSWRTQSQQRGGLRFDKPRGEAGGRSPQKQMLVLQSQRVSLGLNPSAVVYSCRLGHVALPLRACKRAASTIW